MKKKLTAFVLVVVLFISAAPMATLGTFEGLVRVLVPPTLVFDAVYTFRDGLAWVRKDGRSGFVNRYGEVVIPLEFEFAAVFFHDGLARVGRYYDGRYLFGYINKAGEMVVPYQFTFSEAFRGGLARVGMDGLQGFINTSGEVVVPIEFGHIAGFVDGLSPAQRDNIWGVIDQRGNTVIPFTYSSISYMGQGLFRVTTLGEWEYRRTGIVNRYNEVIVPAEFERIGYFREGLAEVVLDGQVGFINKDGALVIPLRDGHVGIRGEAARWWLWWA